MMPSRLTRLVFRKLLSNEPIAFRGCLHRVSLARVGSHNGATGFQQNQRRAFWPFTRKPERQIKEANADPGLDKMSEFTKKMMLRARLPPPEELKTALHQFFKAKASRSESLLGYQAGQSLNILRHLRANPRADGTPWLSLEDLRTAQRTLLKIPSDGIIVESHKALARELYEEIEQRRTMDLQPKEIGGGELFAYVRAMSIFGESIEARTLLLKGLEGPLKQLSAEYRPGIDAAWRAVIAGFGRENNDGELLRTLSIMQEQSQPFTPLIHLEVVSYFVVKDDLARMKEWYNHPIADGKRPSSRATAMVIKACSRNNDLEWCRPIVHSTMEGQLTKPGWDNIFLWAVATGKGTEEIDRMMDVMVQRHPTRQDLRPDITTINKLVRFAVERNDPYSAERYITLGQKRGIEPNGTTYIFQMQYRLSAGDIDGARAAYTNIKSVGFQGSELEGLAAINHLIQAMCAANRYSFETIIAVVEDLSEHKARFEPETVAALSRLHLSRDELYDLIDLIQTHAYHFSQAQIMHIINAFVSFCLDRRNSASRAWDAYSILQSLFNATDRETRTRLMEEFFARGQSDMAVNIFNHMRQASLPHIRPTADTYVAAFVGVAATGDLESLELIHNQLRLDFDIEPNTRMYNALMLAYASTEEPRRALQFWDEICNSREGPSYESIRIAFWACEQAPWGGEKAKLIWEKLRRLDVEISPELLANYVGALAGNKCWDEANELLLKAESELGIKPDVSM